MIADTVVEKNGKKRVLLCMHLPPPVHGASMVGKYIQDSALINNRFDCQYVNITAAATLSDIGRWGIKKFWRYCKLLHHLHHEINLFQPHLVYLTPNSAGRPFYKDYMTVVLLKFWCRRLREKQNTQILLHFHNKGCEDFSKCWINDWLYKRFFNNIHVLLLSKRLYDDVKRYVPEQRVVVCGNGIPAIITPNNKGASDGVQKAHSFSAPIHILFLSNMMEEKGVWTLLNACCLIKERGTDFRCTFVGGWKDITEQMFNEKVEKLGLQTEVSAVGAKYDKEKESYWRDADVFVFPTFYHNECFPLVLLEAMQHALPCISTDEAAIPDIIDNGKTGFVVNKCNYHQLAERIIQLSNDRQMAVNMGMEGFYKYKRLFTLDAFEKRLCDIFEQINADGVEKQ